MVIVRVMYVRRGKKRNECVYARLGSISLTRIVCVCVVRERGKRPVKLLLVCNETLNNAKYPNQKKIKNTFGKNKDLTYIFCGWRTLAMVRLLPNLKTFSNCNQVVSRISCPTWGPSILHTESPKTGYICWSVNQLNGKIKPASLARSTSMTGAQPVWRVTQNW